MQAQLVVIAHELPTSAENESAFIVKHVNATPDKIGWYLMKDSLASIEHVDPKVRRVMIDDILKAKNRKKKIKNNISGRNHVNNYGLSMDIRLTDNQIEFLQNENQINTIKK